MKFPTKYDVGDKIFFISNKKVVDTVIRQININAKKDSYEVIYLCNSEEGEQRIHIKVAEEDAFISKEVLIQSL